MGRGAGGGGLRILPHKSWNVYGYDNQQRVKADEAKHAAETAVIQEALARSEAEFRLGVLRNKARRRQQQEQKETEPDDHGVAGGEGDFEEEDTEEEAEQGLPAAKRQRGIAAAAASSSSSSSRVRFVVQQEAAEDDGAAAAAASSASAAASSSAAEPARALGSGGHFSLFSDAAVGSSQETAAITRQRASDARAAELKFQRQHAPTTLFVEAFRDPATGEDALRPWYARGEGERLAAEHRAREAAKRSVKIKRRTDGRQGVQLSLNTSGLPVHSVPDPLEEMQAHWRAADAAKATAVPSAGEDEDNMQSSTSIVQEAIAAAKRQAAHFQPSATAIAAPPLQRHSSSGFSEQLPPLQPAWATALPTQPDGAPPRRSRWDSNVSNADLHFSARVGFTNSAAAAAAHTHADSAPPALFAAGAAGVNMLDAPSALAVDVSSSSSSSSSSDSDVNRSNDARSSKRSSSDRHSSRRHHSRKSHRHSRDSSRERSSSKSERKKRKRKRSRSRSRSRSPKREKHRKHSSSRRHKREHHKSSHSASAASLLPPSLASLPGASALKSTAELREERTAREREERAKAAALLQVPVWAVAHEHSISQRGLSDEPKPGSERGGGFRGRHPSEFAYNRRS